MEFIAWLIFLFLCTAFTLMIKYYYSLFSDGRSEYNREELLSAGQYLTREWQNLVGDDMATGHIALVVGIFTGLVFSFLGGIYGSHSDSYFFHSALLPGLVFLALPFVRENFSLQIQEGGFVGKLLSADMAALFGFSMATMAQNFTVFFVYQKINFIWILINNLGILALVLYRFYQKETELSPSMGGGAEEDDFSGNENSDEPAEKE